MKIIAMEVGYIATNCYIVVNEETHHGVIIERRRPHYGSRAEGKPYR